MQSDDHRDDKQNEIVKATPLQNYDCDKDADELKGDRHSVNWAVKFEWISRSMMCREVSDRARNENRECTKGEHSTATKPPSKSRQKHLR